MKIEGRKKRKFQTEVRKLGIPEEKYSKQGKMVNEIRSHLAL